jgi:CheY-like chemotaxis protein
MNLVRNACEAMPDGGSLTICTRNRTVEARILGYEVIEPGDYAVMEVTDTGSGISQEHLGKIFDPFFSSKQPGKRSGSGLGLTVVHRVVKDHRGFIDVQSRPGTGTTFTLYFPISKAVVKEGARALPGTGKREVLVVDDVEEHLMTARDKLRQLGFDVVTASSGRRAVDVFHERLSGETAAPGGPPFDLVLMDMVLEQGFDGLDAYRAIARTCPAQRCVIMSGFVPSERVAEARKLGVRGFVRKPYSLDALRRAVQTGLDG